MAIPKDFIRAWYAWQHTSTPIINNQYSHKLECYDRVVHDLEHMASYLYSVCRNVISDGSISNPQIASQEISALARIETELEDCSIQETEKAQFREYMAFIKALLEELAMVPSSLAHTINEESGQR